MATRQLTTKENYLDIHQRFKRIIVDEKLDLYLREDLDSSSPIELVKGAFSDLGEVPTVETLNEWIELYVSAKGWARLRTAIRGLRYKGENKMVSVSMKESSSKALSSWAAKQENDKGEKGISISDAVNQLIEQSNK